MPGVEVMSMTCVVDAVGNHLDYPTTEHIERVSLPASEGHVDVTCPCCLTTRQEAPSVLSMSVKATAARLYAPLNHKKREFRLLTLCSGAFDHEVRCNLIPVSMASKPSYTALSYFRGSRQDRATIKVNGQDISVTESLERALRHLRDPKNPMVLWVDALCINQEDTTEKSSQVGMMRDIYSKASIVAAWLGESAKNSDLAMDLIASIDTLDVEDPNWVPDPIEWRAVRLLFQRQYWRRLWTVPEVLLAKQAVVICGWKQLPMPQFVRFQQAVSYYQTWSEARLKPLQIGETPYSLILSEWANLRKLIAHDGIPVSQLLTTTGRFDCHLPVDKIFAILSISTDIDREVIRIDYSLCFRCLLTRMAKYTFIRREACSPLTFLQTHQADKDPSLPSWVPDYSKYDKEWHLLIPDTDGNKPYTAGATNVEWNALGAKKLLGMEKCDNSAKLRMEGRGSSETLILTGLFVGVVQKALPAPFVDFYTGPDAAEDGRIKRERRDAMKAACLEWEAEIHRSVPENDPYRRSTGGRAEAFWRTIVGDRDLTWKGPPTADWQFDERFQAWMGRGERAHDDDFARPYSHAAIIRTIYRSFLLTEKGYMGLGRSDTRPGDLIVVLRGGDVPFILRRADQGTYRFIGEAYVHGIMDGSWVRRSKKGDVSSFRIQ